MENGQVGFGGGSASMLGPTQRLTLGILVLILVDVIWVASSELSSYIFHDEKFDKPFFSTYVKTSMFLIFLVGFVLWTPWNERCVKREDHTYTLIATEAEALVDEAVDIDDNANDATLSPSVFIPTNFEPNSGNDSDDSLHQRSVRFNKLAEVRQLSESEAAEAILARMSYEATIQAEQLAYRLANKLSISETANMAITFCLLWFVANYTYQLAISHTQVGIVNVLSSSSSLFTLVLASIFPSVVQDRITLSKLLAVLLSIAGVVVVSMSDFRVEHKAIPFGAVFSLVSAFFYAAYLVFLRKKVDHEDKMDIPLFFGFVGLFNLILLWPLFILFNYTELEHFEWPSKRQWLFLVINGIIGTVFSEVLWLWGCFLTSSLIATLAISLTIPLSMAADILLDRVSYSGLFYIGAIPMVVSFFAVTALSHYENWDPIADILKKISFRRDVTYQRVLVNQEIEGDFEEEEGNSLLSHSDTADNDESSLGNSSLLT